MSHIITFLQAICNKNVIFDVLQPPNRMYLPERSIQNFFATLHPNAQSELVVIGDMLFGCACDCIVMLIDCHGLSKPENFLQRGLGGFSLICQHCHLFTSLQKVVCLLDSKFQGGPRGEIPCTRHLVHCLLPIINERFF